jgi:uncharacterized membrane protein YfcA
MSLDIIAIGYGSLVGLSLGLTGSGGSILAIPLLVYGLDIPVSEAIVISLLMVATIALFGALRQSFSKNVNWQSAILFSISGMIISPIIIQLAHGVDEILRLVLFAGLMLFVSYRMVFGGKKDVSKDLAQNKFHHFSFLNNMKIALGGATAGGLSGFFGVGGGFVIVPLLTTIFNMSYKIAVGTSLASIFLISLAAVSGAFLKGIVIDWFLFFNFVSGGIVGMFIGSALVNSVPNHLAKIIFAAVTSILAIFILIDKLLIQQGVLS